MRRRLKTVFRRAYRSSASAGIAIGLIVTMVSSCGGGEAPAPPARRAPEKSAAPAPKPETVQTAPEVTVEVVSVQEEVEYRYDARSRRDPFRSVLDLAKSKERLAELPPLQRVEIIDMKVTAIVWGTLGPTALIKTPDGKGYTVRPGTLVGPNKGVIERISESAIMIREQSVDIFGVKKTRQIELELHPQEEGKE